MSHQVPPSRRWGRAGRDGRIVAIGRWGAVTLPASAGRLEPGLEADLVVLDGDPKQDIRALAGVRYTFRHGRQIYSRE